MKFIDINREFTAAANSYMAQGYYINAGTMGGSQGEVAHIDLTNGTDEALRDWTGNVKPLSDWVLVRVYNGDLWKEAK